MTRCANPEAPDFCLQLAQRLGELPSKSRAAANDIIAEDPSVHKSAAAGRGVQVRLSSDCLFMKPTPRKYLRSRKDVWNSVPAKPISHSELMTWHDESTSTALF